MRSPGRANAVPVGSGPPDLRAGLMAIGKLGGGTGNFTKQKRLR